NRYNAACMAARAGCGAGEDAARLSEQERARWRQQALDWLRADLKLMSEELEHRPDQAVRILPVALPYWLKESALAGIPEEAGLARLPATERDAWRQLWADANALLMRARGRK